MSMLTQTSQFSMGTQATPFAHGKGRKFDIKSADGLQITFPIEGTLIYPMKDFGGESSDRRPLVIRVDQHSSNDLEAIKRLDEHIFEHTAENSSTFFAPKPPSRDTLREKSFGILQNVNGRLAIKTRADITKVGFYVPDPNGDPNADEVASLQIPQEYLERALVRGALVSGEVSVSFGWLDDKISYGVSVSFPKLMVRPPLEDPPLLPHELQDEVANIEFGSDTKKFDNGGKFVCTTLMGEYVRFALNQNIGAGSDSALTMFAPSAGKDAPADSTNMSVPVVVPAGSVLFQTMTAMNEMVLGVAVENPRWFGSKTLSRETAESMATFPFKVGDDGNGRLYLKLHGESVPGRDASKVWVVPEGLETTAMASITDPGALGMRAGTIADIEQSTPLGVKEVSVSCLWIQASTFGYSCHLKECYVEPGGGGSGLQLNGKRVRSNGKASAADMDLAFGALESHKRPRDDCDDGGQNYEDKKPETNSLSGEPPNNTCADSDCCPSQSASMDMSQQVY